MTARAIGAVARAGKPRWVRILAMTEGSSMAARIVKVPPHCGHCSMSISNTRLRKPSLAFALWGRRPPFKTRSRRFCEQPGPAQAGWCREMGRVNVNRTGRKHGF